MTERKPCRWETNPHGYTSWMTCGYPDELLRLPNWIREPEDYPWDRDMTRRDCAGCPCYKPKESSDDR